MAFTEGSVELARATRLGQKLSAYHNSMSGNDGITTGRDLQLITKLARNGRMFITGFTSGAGFPPIGTNNVEGLTYSNNAATYNAGTTLGANVGLTLGVFYKTLNTARVHFNNTVEETRAVFGGTMAGTSMTVTGVTSGAIVINQNITGSGITFSVRVSAFGTGVGGLGTYTITPGYSMGTANSAFFSDYVSTSSGGLSAGLVIPSNITGYAQNLQGFTATINMVTGAVS